MSRHVKPHPLMSAWHSIVQSNKHEASLTVNDVPCAVTARSRMDATHRADLVVKRGRAIKNRFGRNDGVPIDLLDGYYLLVRLEPPKRRTRKS